jgi:hypothetical protein
MRNTVEESLTVTHLHVTQTILSAKLSLGRQDCLRHLMAILLDSVAAFASNEQQEIPPLRYASVGMTGGSSAPRSMSKVTAKPH